MTDRPDPINAYPGGVDFQVHFCMECERDAEFADGGDGCPIVAAAVASAPASQGFPAEITKLPAGWTCSAFAPLGTRLPTESELEAAGQLSIMDGAS
jgi:hypothetical protein